MKRLKIIIIPNRLKQKELLLTCRMIVNLTRQKPGCMDCHQVEDNIDENSIIIEQQWQQRQQLDDYFRSDHFIALLGTMKWLGEHYEITIDDGTPEEGITAVENARATKIRPAF